MIDLNFFSFREIVVKNCNVKDTMAHSGDIVLPGCKYMHAWIRMTQADDN
jgi:hypothetical protein